MRYKRIAALIIVLAMFMTCLPVAGANIPAGLTNLSVDKSSAITVEQSIVMIMINLGKSPSNKPAGDLKGQKSSVWASGYVAEALSKGWLPSPVPKLSQKADKRFVTGFFLGCLGYKVFQTDITAEQQYGIDTMLSNVAYKTSVTASNGVNALKADSNKSDVSKLLKAYNSKVLGIYIKSVGWQLYTAGKTDAAGMVFKLCVDAGPNAGNTLADYTNELYGYGALMSHSAYKNYFAASESLKKIIKLSPNSADAKNAVNLLKKLPAVQLGLDYAPEKPVSYEELLAAYADGLYLNVNSAPKDFVVKDKKGELPSEWAKKFVNYVYSKNLAPSIPSSFKDVAPRWWVASFAARIKFLTNYEYDKYYSFSDLSKLTADDRMFINIALDRKLFPMPGTKLFEPDGSVLRKELRSLINSSKKPGVPHKAVYSKDNYKKIIDSYYMDNGLIHFTTQNDIINKRYEYIDIVNYSTVYHYMDDSHKNDFNNRRYIDEGTKYIRTRYALNQEIKSGIDNARAKNVKALLNFDAKGERAYTIIKDFEKRRDIVKDLVHLAGLYNMDGVHICFEHMPKDAREAFSSFIQELSKELKPKGKLLTTVVGAYSSDKYESQSAYDISLLGEFCDYVKIILYDDFPVSRYPYTGKDGPISRLEWNERMLKYAVQKIPSRKILLGMGAYGIDFNITNKKDAKLVALADVGARISSAKPGTIKYLYNDEFKCPYIEFTDTNGDQHRLWYEDKKSLSLRMEQVHKYQLGGIFYFWVGSDSQDLFDAIAENLR